MCSKFSVFFSNNGFSQYISNKDFSSKPSEFWRWSFENIALFLNFQRYIRTILRFTKEAEVPKQAFPFVTGRNIRTLNVIFETHFVSLRRSRRIKKRLNLSHHVISELLKRFASTKGTLLVLRKIL